MNDMTARQIADALSEIARALRDIKHTLESRLH